MKRKIAALVLTALFVLAGLSGCQQAATTAAATETTTAAAAFPVTVQDASGQDIVIASAPQAIVATNIWAAEMLFGLVDTGRIKGLSAWGDNPVLSATAEQAKSVATRVTTGEPESIVALKPDLVIIDTFSDPDGSLTKTLADTGATVLQMNSPTNFDEIKAAITTIAAATGEQAKGKAMVAEIDAKLQAVQDKLAGLTEDQKLKVLYYEDYYDQTGSNAGMLAAYGQGSPFESIAKAAGLVNVCTAPNYSAISKEKVVGEWKPDLLVVPSITYTQDFAAVEDHGATIIAAIKTDGLLQTLPAVQNGKIIALTEKYRGSTSQYMADAVAELAKAAYPDLFQ